MTMRYSMNMTNNRPEETMAMIPHGGAPTSRREQQYATKRQAQDAAKAIGWRVSDVRNVDRMGFSLWVIMDEQARIVTQEQYARLLVDRQMAQNKAPGFEEGA